MPRELLDHVVEIGIAGAKASREPIPTAFGYFLPIRHDVELTGLARGSHGFNVETLFDEGHETRSLGLVVLSRRAVKDLDLHSVLRFIVRSHLTPELSDAGGPAHPHWQATWPARVRSSDLVRPRHFNRLGVFYASFAMHRARLLL